MKPTAQSSVILTAAVVLGYVASAVAHGSEPENINMDMGGMSMARPTIAAATNGTMAEPASYFQLKEHTGLMFAHILLMTLGWVFVLPIGK